MNKLIEELEILAEDVEVHECYKDSSLDECMHQARRIIASKIVPIIKHLRAGEELQDKAVASDGLLGSYACGEHLKVRKLLHRAIKAYDEEINP